MESSMQAISFELQACIVDFLEPRQVMLIKPLQLKIKSQFEDLILVLTSWRAFLLQQTLPLRVESTFSYLEISDIDIRDHKLVVFDTDSCVYPFQFMSLEDLEQVIIHVTTSIKKVVPDTSPGKLIRKNSDLHMKFTKLADFLDDFTQTNQGPCGGFSETYAALCDYNGFVLREEIQWDIDNIYSQQESREFRLLDFTHLDTSDVALAVASLSFNQWFTKLCCKDFRLRLEISEQILYVIGKSLKIEELVLENCGLKCDFAVKMAQALDNNPGTVLHSINLSGNQMEDRGISAISRHFDKSQILHHLNFARTSVTPKGMNSLFQSLAFNENFSNSLCHLDLSGNHGILATEDSINLYNFLSRCTSLCHLNLSGTDCALDTLLGSLLHGCCTTLSYLNASRNIYSHRKVKDMSPAISQFFSKTSALKYLELSGTKLPSNALRSIFQGLSSNDTINDLHMDLSDCELRSSGAQVIQDMIFDVNAVSTLDISGNGFNSEMVTLILSIGRSKSIKHVSLGKNFNSKINTTEVLHRIVQLLQDEDCPIQSLSLADSRLKSGTNIILNALGSNSSLTKIDISGNAIGDTGAKLLAKALQMNIRLRTLIWDRNNTTAFGFLDVAHAMERNYSLMSMPFPISDISQAYRLNPGKTEDALHQIQNYLLRNNNLACNVSEKVNDLQNDTTPILSQEMVNEMCTNIQERIELLSTCTGKEIETDILFAEEAVRDANFTISVLPVLYEAWLSPYKNSKLQHKLDGMIDDISKACSQEIQNFSQLILDTAENICPKILQKLGVKENLVDSVSGRIIYQKNMELRNSLDSIIKDALNKLNDMKLFITTTIADTITAEVLKDLTVAQSKLENKFSKTSMATHNIQIELEDNLLTKVSNLLDITRKDISAEECKIYMQRRIKTLRNIRPTPTLKGLYKLDTDALAEDKDTVESQMLLPFSCSPLKPLPISIKDAENTVCLLPSTQPACTEHLMDLPTEGEKLQHCTQQRPRPNRTNRQPNRKPHVQTSGISEINENNVYTRVDEGIDEFFTKKLIQNDQQIPLKISTEPTVLSSGSRTFKKKIGEFFALRKPKSSKGTKSEKDSEGSPVIVRGRKQTLTDILRPLGKGNEALKGQDKTENASSAEARSVDDPTWTPDAVRRIRPRYSREGKSQSLILLSADDEESLGIKQEKRKHCEKTEGEVCNTFEHRVHSMLHRIGVIRVLSSDVKKKQSKDGEIKKAGSEGDIVDNSADSPTPALKVRMHSMPTESTSPKAAEPTQNPKEERLIWKDLGKQLNAELKNKCMEIQASPGRSLAVLEHTDPLLERKSEDSWSLPERCSPTPSPSRIIHLESASEAKDNNAEVFGNDENLLKPRMRLKQFQNRRAVSAHEEQLRDHGYTSELESVKNPLGRLQRSPVMKLKQRIEASTLLRSELTSNLLAEETDNWDHRMKPAHTEHTQATKSEGNVKLSHVETAQNTAIDQRTELLSSQPPSDNY
ncbi:capping protein, Arp2/3 and myosin-I linker protein 2 [Mixophyes fleayi]|uniref:capping protein, Arp2/3 and myosin-I linker protein 2 n=1 Tax=Mixophyes fleayi TaxID=3061075 RepID=UPI003F4DFD62